MNLATAKYPPLIRCRDESADNPASVQLWRGHLADLERHNAYKPARRLADHDAEGAFLAAHAGMARKPFGKKGVEK